MEIKCISSLENRYVKSFRLLLKKKYRLRYGKIVLEGFRLIEEALKAGLVPEIFFFEQDLWQREKLKSILRKLPPGTIKASITKEILYHLSETETPQGVLAVAPFAVNSSLQVSSACNHFLLIIDRLQDPGNMGTIIRTAAAAGIKETVLTKGTIDPTNPKVVRSSMGAVFYLQFSMSADTASLINKLKEKDIQLIASSPKADLDYTIPDYRQPTAFVIGNESKGVDPSILKAATYKVKIPLLGPVESLNAASAAAILIYEGVRQRHSL
ncbi:MAG: TrmH family RNA methyltransferase [Dethiobacteria bacterium]|jgi:TrmH family RNA methyltransferase